MELNKINQKGSSKHPLIYTVQAALQGKIPDTQPGAYRTIAQERRTLIAHYLNQSSTSFQWGAKSLCFAGFHFWRLLRDNAIESIGEFLCACRRIVVVSRRKSASMAGSCTTMSNIKTPTGKAENNLYHPSSGKSDESAV